MIIEPISTNKLQLISLNSSIGVPMSGDSQELSCLFVGLKPLGIMKETYTLKDS
jgi:hypothetical protein